MRSAFSRWLFTLVFPLLFLGCGSLDTAVLGDLLGATAPLDEATVASGLREALEVGTQRAIGTVSVEGGFANDAVRRLVIPENLQTMASRLRTAGFGNEVDRFEAQMNTAAEQAAGLAFDVFAGAVRGMSIQDAFSILNGPQDAATVYFRGRTEAELITRFGPVVDNVMNELGIVRLYDDLVTRYNSIPLVRRVEFDLDAYVVDRTLEGLFQTLAQEEARIRRDPVARTTRLLQRVFGSVNPGP